MKGWPNATAIEKMRQAGAAQILNAKAERERDAALRECVTRRDASSRPALPPDGDISETARRPATRLRREAWRNKLCEQHDRPSRRSVRHRANDPGNDDSRRVLPPS